MTWLFFAAFLLAYLVAARLRKYALSAHLLDLPNIRSSHTVPTPRGGGLGIFFATTMGVIYLVLTKALDQQLALSVGVGGIAIALVGFMDDRGSLSVAVRLLVHAAAAAWAMYALGGMPILQFGDRFIDFGPYGDILGFLLIIWTLNLFNFMDGIDGIAASEAVFVVSAGAGLAYFMGKSHSVSLVSALLAAACLGFLVLNWPPAKIFMGDVGSGYLGYVIAVLAIAEARTNPVALFVWLTLGGVFFVDATVTLIRRLVHGERVYEAHRSHAYQWLARRWNSHRRVTILTILVNVCWLLPLAGCCVLFPSHAWWISLGSLVPLIVLALIAGAGRPERISVT